MSCFVHHDYDGRTPPESKCRGCWRYYHWLVKGAKRRPRRVLLDANSIEHIARWVESVERLGPGED